MKHNALQHIFDVTPYTPGKPIDEVKRELGLDQVIKLASNESPYGPSPKVLKALVQQAKNVNRYPDGGCYNLREALAQRLKVDPHQLIFGNGSDEIIVMAIRAFVGKSDEVVMARPSFLIYDIASRLAGARIRAVPLQDFCYDLEGMSRAVTRKTKIVFIGNPDNPAGTFVSHSDLEAFLNGIRRDVLVFIDEAYYEYVHDPAYPDSLQLLKSYPNLMIARTFSKMYGLAGLRVGYGVAQADVIDIVNRLREPFNVNSLAQAAALACLQDQDYYRRIAQEVEKERQFLYRQFERLGLSCVRTVTNFVLVHIPQGPEELAQQLLKKGVIVRDMKAWGLNTYIRVTIGKPSENRLMVKALRDVLEGKNK
jgi:histidinol-phosphate aminotransferase